MVADAGWLNGTCQTYRDPIGAADRALMRHHCPERPTWACTACGEAWPCRIARVTLEDEFRADILRLTMACYLHEAAKDLIGARPGALYDRFLLWISVGAAPARAVGSSPVPKP